jgi:hypothetical protein
LWNQNYVTKTTASISILITDCHSKAITRLKLPLFTVS